MELIGKVTADDAPALLYSNIKLSGVSTYIIVLEENVDTWEETGEYWCQPCNFVESIDMTGNPVWEEAKKLIQLWQGDN